MNGITRYINKERFRFSLAGLILLLFVCVKARADVFSYTKDKAEVPTAVTGMAWSVLEDKEGTLTYQQAFNAAGYQKIDKQIANLGVSNSVFWLKASVHNGANSYPLLLMLEQPQIDKAEIYSFSNGSLISVDSISKWEPFYNRTYHDANYVFNTGALPDSTVELLIKIKSSAQLVFPIKLGTEKQIAESSDKKELLYALFSGIIIVMSLYNLFVYFTVRDRSYLLYVIYILLVGVTQTTLPGFTFKYLWPQSSWMALQAPTIFACLGAMAAIEFIKEFLRTKEHVRRLHYGLLVFNGIFVVGLLFSLSGNRTLGFQIMQANTAIASLYSLYTSYRIYKLGYRPAKFFLYAWTILLIGAVVFVLKDAGIVPYNTLTTFALQITSVIEVVLLSFALADKINILRKEREEAQALAVTAAQENARIVKEQNVILEAKVSERTKELKESNDGLNKALKDLKDAEMQLVESEKMASLGQLTAGIAHEINNPINFVTSNVKPLKRDVDMLITMLNQVEEISLLDEPADGKRQKIDSLKEEYDFDYLKTEIQYLLNGIHEGSSRTAEIVKGLRIFSRLDEDDLKKADINEGLESTMVIVNNQIDNVRITKNYGDLPLVECYPGKLNQVFLNMISNALHAVKSRHGNEKTGELTIGTYRKEDKVYISIKDNGTGMNEDTKKKLFEPFFTTKDVGEGTGLGLSIAYNTIVKHNGAITVNSVLGEGTEFLIEIPIVHQ